MPLQPIPLYTEDGINIQQIKGDRDDIWTTYTGGAAYIGTRSW